MDRGRISNLSASLAISGSKVGIMRSSASMNVTSEPRAVNTSENSRPIYPLPTMASHSGTLSSLRPPSLVKTVFSSTSMPRGTKGSDPGARMMSLARTTRLPACTSCGPFTEPFSGMTSTPRPVSEFSSPDRTLAARFLAWSAIACLSYLTLSTVTPRALRWCAFRSSRTRPDAANRAFDGTQPLLTHVPPTSPPVRIAVFRPLPTACSAAPWPPTPQPIITRS
mmetsp:Transcript_17770/g.42715  ORF Transcript_17770/g.42715 Transcript_17770/m.42715 type:complete len:224 (-) Transcript_17770:340-1011(-)